MTRQEFKKTNWKMSYEQYQLCNCTECKKDCIHRNAFRRVPRCDGGLGLCPNLNKKVVEHMTIKQCIEKKGWAVECDTTVPYRVMNVQISFDNEEGKEDETEFSIKAYDEDELDTLFVQFCKENNCKPDTVNYIAIVQVADSFDKLD